MNDIVFDNALVLDTLAGAIAGERCVLVRGGRIAEISETRLDAPEARRIDVAGRVLMPGLCDAHVHVTAAPPASRARSRKAASPESRGPRPTPSMMTMTSGPSVDGILLVEGNVTTDGLDAKASPPSGSGWVRAGSGWAQPPGLIESGRDGRSSPIPPP